MKRTYSKTTKRQPAEALQVNASIDINQQAASLFARCAVVGSELRGKALPDSGPNL
jgi:hypothetical protein